MNPQESSPASIDPRMREWMSAWVDGQRDAESSACSAWAANPQAQGAWHEYHLIGDVLRSEDLASSPSHDQAFLASFRQRLAAEPIVLAPSPAPGLVAAPRAASRRWAVAAAVAGVMMVGGAVLSLQRVAGPADLADASGGTPAGAATGGAAVLASLPASGARGEPQWRVDGQMIRDARLDAYLRAHRGGQAARPGAVSGRFETVVLER